MTNNRNPSLRKRTQNPSINSPSNQQSDSSSPPDHSTHQHHRHHTHRDTAPIRNPCPTVASFLVVVIILFLTPLILKYGHHPSLLTSQSKYSSAADGGGFMSRLMQMFTGDATSAHQTKRPVPLSEDELSLCPFQQVKISSRGVVLCVNAISLDNVVEFPTEDEKHSSNNVDTTHPHTDASYKVPKELVTDPTEGKEPVSVSEGGASIPDNPEENSAQKKTVKILFLHDPMTDYSLLYSQQLARILSHVKRKDVEHFQIIFFDWRGYGMSIGAAAHSEPHVKDLRTVWKKYEMDLGTTFVVANGLGALLFAEFERRYESQVDGVVLVGAPLVLGDGFRENPSNWFIAPKYVSQNNRVVQALSSLLPYYPVLTPPISWLVSSATPSTPPPTERARERYALDKFVPLPITARLLNIRRETLVKLKPEKLPWEHVLILQASGDKIAHPSSASILKEKLKANDVTVKMFDASHHNILHEESVDEFVVEWMKERF